jgi:sterol desaturase/sphingolipid hydroxylase (fatty acid hydroxylase superfamily)
VTGATDTPRFDGHPLPMDARLVLAMSVALTILFVFIDARDPIAGRAFRSSWWDDRRRARRNVAFLLSNLVTIAALGACTRALEGAVSPVIAWPSGAAGRVGEIAACLLVAELVNWVSHWAKHRHWWLWRFHLPHHVETRYNVSLTLHTHGLEVLVSGCAMAALLSLFGFSRLAVDVFSLCYFGANLYKHTSARLSLGPLDALIVSPAYHRLHHAKGYDVNFGSVLTVFDVLFGTARFPRGQERDEAFALPVGVTSPEPFGYIDEMLAPFFPVSASLPDAPPPREQSHEPRPEASLSPRASLPRPT